MKEIILQKLSQCASYTLRNKRSLDYGFTFKTYVGAKDEYATISVPDEYKNGLWNCWEVKNMLVEFRVQSHRLTTDDLEFDTSSL